MNVLPAGREARGRVGRHRGSLTRVSSRESWASSPAARAIMQANKRRDTKPEMAVRRAVHRRGLRYLVDARPLPDLNRRADLVFTRARVAVFIDGCYWHGCPAHATSARANADYWAPKIAGNIARDRDTDQRLEAAGWAVVRAWEHEDADEVALAVVAAVREGLGLDARAVDSAARCSRGQCVVSESPGTGSPHELPACSSAGQGFIHNPRSNS